MKADEASTTEGRSIGTSGGHDDSVVQPLSGADRMNVFERELIKTNELVESHDRFLYGRTDEYGVRHPGFAQRFDDFVAEVSKLQKTLAALLDLARTVITRGAIGIMSLVFTVACAAIWYTAHHWTQFLHFAGPQ